MYIQEVGSGLQSPAVVLSQQGSPGGGRVVPAGCVSILQWGEFLLPRYFKGNEVPGGEEFITLHPSQLLHSGQARVGQSSLNGSLFHEYGGLGGTPQARKAPVLSRDAKNSQALQFSLATCSEVEGTGTHPATPTQPWVRIVGTPGVVPCPLRTSVLVLRGKNTLWTSLMQTSL